MTSPEQTRSSDDDAAELATSTSFSRRWPLLLLVLVVLGGGLGLLVWWLLAPEQRLDKLVVIARVELADGQRVASWQDEDAPRFVAEAVGEQLRGLGFDLAGKTSEEAARLRSELDWDNACELAPKLGAGAVVRLEVRVQRVVPLDTKLADFALSLDAEVCDVSEGRFVAVEGLPLALFEWGREPSQAIVDASPRAALAAVAPLAAGLAALPRYAPMDPGCSRASDCASLDRQQNKAAARLEALFRLAGHYARELKRRDTEAREVDKDREAVEASPLDFEALSAPLVEEYLIGERHDGKLVLLAEPHFVDVLPGTGEYSLRRESEQLALADASSGAERQPLFEHFNFFSSQHISANGRTLAAVLDNRQRSKWLVSLQLDSGELRLLASSSEQYYSTPTLSPDGQRVVFWLAANRHAPSALELIDTQTLNQRTLIEAGAAMSLPRWSPDGRTIYLTAGDESRENLIAVDLDSGERRALLGPLSRPAEPAPSASAPSPVADPTAPPREAEEPTADTPSAPQSPVADDAPGAPPASASANPALDESEREHLAALANPSWGSRFDLPVLSPDGRFIVLAEQAADGTLYLGRYELESASYRRLRELVVFGTEMSPTGEFVAVSTRAELDVKDPRRGDIEIALVDTDDGSVHPVTLNDAEDFFAGFSRDGRAVYVGRQWRDPTGQRYTSRVYRYRLPDATP